MYKKKVQMWKAKTSMHITHDNEWGMGEVAKRLGSQLLMHQAKVKQHQQRDVNTETNSVYNSVLLNNLTYTVHSVAVGGSVKVIFLIIPWKKILFFLIILSYSCTQLQLLLLFCSCCFTVKVFLLAKHGLAFWNSPRVTSLWFVPIVMTDQTCRRCHLLVGLSAGFIHSHWFGSLMLHLWHYLQRRISAGVKFLPLAASETFRQRRRRRTGAGSPHAVITSDCVSSICLYVSWFVNRMTKKTPTWRIIRKLGWWTGLGPE